MNYKTFFPSTLNLPLSGVACPLRRKGNASRTTFNIQHSTFNIQHSTFNIQHSTFNIQHSTFNIQHSTFNIQHSTFQRQAPGGGDCVLTTTCLYPAVFNNFSTTSSARSLAWASKFSLQAASLIFFSVSC